MKLPKNIDPEKYGCIDYGIEFKASSQISFSNCDWGKNIVIFGVAKNSSGNTNNRKKFLLKDHKMD